MERLREKKAIRWILAWLIVFTVAISSAPVMAAGESDTISFGTKGTQLTKGKTYIVPVSLKNASNLSQDSVAKACLGKYAQVDVDAEGSATFRTDLRRVKIGTATDYAKDIRVYQGEIGSEKVAATVLSEQTVTTTSGESETTKTVPKEIEFAIPTAVQDKDGVYISLYVDTMGYAPDTYILIDWEKAVESGAASLNYRKQGSDYVEQFGKYYIDADVTVEDGKISDLNISGREFAGTHEATNKAILASAIAGIKDKIIGLYDTDAEAINDVDVVTGATTSSKTIKAAVMDALGLEVQEEAIPEPPESVPEPGTYKVKIKDITDVVKHSLVESETGEAILRVDKNGKMTLSYKMISGTTKEPLHVLGLNGYYTDNNSPTEDTLSKDGIMYNMEECQGYQVVTDFVMPLSEPSKYYYKNVYLYVEAMKNLDGLLSGVLFDHGKFNIKSTVTLYWDSLEKVDEADKSQLYSLCEKAMNVKRSSYTAASLANLDKALQNAKNIYFNVEAGDAQVKAAVTALNTALGSLKSNATITAAPKAPAGVKAASAAYNKVKVSWSKVSGATGYEVLQYNSSTKKYSRAALVKGTSYTKSGLKTGTKYSFRVRAYKTAGGKTVYSPYSNTVSAKPTLARVTKVKTKNNAGRNARITWKRVAGANGYKIYRATKKKGKYRAVKMLKSGRTVKFTNKKLKKGKRYYYKVRAYRNIGKKKVYGKSSIARSVKIRK